MAAATTKKSFDFRMSKKVAELTQVVHMLFTRNHEKEVEIEALKEAYEYEIDLVIKDARSKMEKLEARIRELEKKHHGDTSQFQALLTQELERKDDEWRKKCTEADKQLQNEKKDCQSVRDLLINAQKDIERLKNAKSDELKNTETEKHAQTKEIHSLKTLVNKLQKEIKDMEGELGDTRSLRKTNDRLQTEVCKLKEAGNNSDSAKDELIHKVKELENEVRRLRREQSRSRLISAGPKIRQDFAEVPNAEVTDYDEEMIKMKKLLDKYKLELRNREGNFNRMFTEKQPVFVDKRAGRSAMTGFKHGGDMSHFRYTRERTYHPGTMRSTSAIDEDLRELTVMPHSASSSTSSSMGMFPQLPPGDRDSRLKTPQLMKPKPLPRDMLSAKTAGH